MEHEMKSLPVAVIADPISGHLFSLPFATPTLRTAMSWQRSLTICRRIAGCAASYFA